jgi:hypothetical protein
VVTKLCFALLAIKPCFLRSAGNCRDSPTTVCVVLDRSYCQTWKVIALCCYFSILFLSRLKKITTTIKKRRKDRSYLLRRRDCWKKDHNSPPPNSCPGFEPRKVLSFSSENEHDKRTVTSTQLIRSAKRLKEQRKQVRKPDLGSCPGEDVFSNSVIKQDRTVIHTCKHAKLCRISQQ